MSTAGDWDRYPSMPLLVEELTRQLAPRPVRESLPIVRDVLLGLARAERKGLIRTGDDREFTTAAHWADAVLHLAGEGAVGGSVSRRKNA